MKTAFQSKNSAVFAYDNVKHIDDLRVKEYRLGLQCRIQDFPDGGANPKWGRQPIIRPILFLQKRI